MKLTQIPNLRTEDFSSEQEWISKLFIQLNPLIQSLNQILDQNIDYSTNIKSQTRDYTITSFQSFSFTWSFPGTTPIDLRVVKATKTAAQTPTILQAAWRYDSTNNLITVTRMIELNDASVSQLSGQYQFTVRVTV